MDRSNSKFMKITSPYSKYYKPRLRADQNDLLTKRLGASKLTRKELENKYYDLCEENVIVKRENNENKEKIKHLTTKLLRLTSSSGRSIKPRELFTTDDTLKVRLIDLENKNSMLKDQMNSMISKYGKKLKDLPIFSPHAFDTNRDEPMDSKGDEKSGALSIKSPMFNSMDDLYSTHGSASTDRKKVDLTEDEEVLRHNEEEKHLKQTHEIEKLQEEINALNNCLEETRQTNIELLKEISDLRTKWSEIDLSKKLAEDMKIIELNRCLEEAKSEMLHLKCYTDQIEKEACGKIDHERKISTELEEKLKAESDKSLDYATKLERAEQERKQLDELEKVLKQKNLEIETLRDQSDKFQAIANNSGEDDTKMQQLVDQNDELKKNIEIRESASSSLEHSHANLLEKVKLLQSQNDELIVELEGKKNENSFLKERNAELETELKKLKTIQVELEQTKNTLCRRMAEYRNKLDINNFTIVSTDAWSNKFPQISETYPPLVEKGSGDVCIPADCEYEIPVKKINSDPKVSSFCSKCGRFYSRPDYHQKYIHKSTTFRYENLQTQQHKNLLQIFESPKIQMERARNTRRALKYYRYYHNMVNSTKMQISRDHNDCTNNTGNFSDLSSIQYIVEETLQGSASDSPEELSMSDLQQQQSSIMSISCENGNNERKLVNFTIDSLNWLENSYSHIEIEFINKIDRQSKRYSLDSTKLQQQQIFLDNGNKFNFLLIFSELNRNEFGFSIFQNEFEENDGGKMDIELDVYDICFPHKLLGKLFMNIFI